MADEGIEAEYELAERLMADPAALEVAQELAAAHLEDRNPRLHDDQIREAMTYLKGFKAVLDAGAFPERLFVVLEDAIGQDEHGLFLRHGNDEGVSFLSLYLGRLLETLQRELPSEDV